MQKTTRISYTNKATIPSGIPYENQSPSYTITQEFNLGENEVIDVKKEIDEIKSYVDGLINKDFETLANFRGRDELPEDSYHIIGGKKIPRVTKIISPDRLDIPFIEDHAELGIMLDKEMKKYIDTGIFNPAKFKDAGNIKQTWEEVVEAMAGWIETYRDVIKFKAHSLGVLNEEHSYCGELDAIAEMGGKLYICDFKKTKRITKELEGKYFMQMAAYANAKNKDHIVVDGMIIISPYNKIIVSMDIGAYFVMFLAKREEFRKRFGI